MNAPQSNVDRMRLFTDQVQKGGRLDLIDGLVSADFLNHTPNSGQGSDREGLRMATATLHSAFSDFTVEIMHCIGEGELVATHKVFRGRHTGDWFGVGEAAGIRGHGPRPLPR